ncbi:DNA -binding domain-containing protein [Blastomonas aquatica]|nr:DUF2285 domain-containing protein [Blastomonas aquatica]
MPLAFIVPRDELAPVRHRACARLDGRASTETETHLFGLLHPTEFQRQRLQLLCDVLDLVVVPASRPLTSHQLALQRIYPGMTVARGAEWKSSSHRRRTQRLISEARAMMNGGYRALLAGGEGRQKRIS